MKTVESLHVGIAQINPHLADWAFNLQCHRHWIAQAHQACLDLLVFPELSLTGYGLGAKALDVACSRDDPRLLLLAAECGSLQCVVGFVEQAAPGELYNALAILRDGQVQAVHRKLNLPTYGGLEEGKLFGTGRQLTHTPVGESGWHASHLICADLWNPALVHAAMLHRPDLLIAPINSASGIVSEQFSNEDNWLLNARFYAMTYTTPVLLANRFGLEGSNRFWGGSCIIGPRGNILASQPNGEGLLHVELERRDIARARFDLPTVRDANTPLIRELLANF